MQTQSRRFENWIEGIPYEIAFWKSYYGNKKRRKDLFGWSMYDKDCVLDNFDINTYIKGLGNDKPKIMDVGCALSYMFGNIINGKKHDIIYLDPLAHFYNKILNKYKIERPRIEFGSFETLSFFFDSDSIDFIHIRNALDHSSDPVGGILQALKVLKKGGILYLNHFLNEGENEGYRGFHQFNLTEENGDFIVWNKKERTNVTELLRGVAEVTTTLTPQGRIVTVIKKTGEIPETLFNTREISRENVKNLFSTIEYFNSLPNSFKHQIRRLYTTIGHKTMRLLPYSLLNKIKKLAGK